MFLKLDYRNIRVEAFKKSMPLHVGSWHPREGVIRIDATQAADEQAETLIHEIIHAIWGARHLGAKVDEETAATQLASGLATMLRDNPGLPKILDNALNHQVGIFKMSKAVA